MSNETTLRSELNRRATHGEKFTVSETLHLLVPLCTEVAQRHKRGEIFFLSPAALSLSAGAVSLHPERAHSLPTGARDQACIAPEARAGVAPGARSTVFSVGAILYEMLTLTSVGPGMRRPHELSTEVRPELEIILAKALVADPTHRPADLGALAQALHNVAPMASVKPPPADESHLDHDVDFDVDTRLSYVPPDAPPLKAPPPPRPPMPTDPTQKLADLKASLESDPRPRYVVIKDQMDHGPFSAVELLHHIALGSFTAGHTLRDMLSSESRDLADWPQFASFAEQAQLGREIRHEKQQLFAVVAAEKKGTRNKAIIFGGVLVSVLAVGGIWWASKRAAGARELAVHGDESLAVNVDGDLKGAKGAGRTGGGSRSGGGNYPQLAGGLSCEAAQDKYTTEYKMGGAEGPADLTAGAYGAVLNSGGYLGACNVPSSMAVSICAAVQNGRAVGVTVTTTPSNPGISSCVARQVRGLSYPSHPRLDVTRTTFAAN